MEHKKSAPSSASLPRADVIKAAIDPRAFYSREFPGIELRAGGEDRWTQNLHCPFHEDRNNSFGVNLISGGFKCFGCGAQGGSILDYLMRRDGLDLRAAKEALARDWGIRPPGVKTPDDRASRRPLSTTKQMPARSDWRPIPADKLESRPQRHPRLGEPSHVWRYTAPDGGVLMFVTRFDPDKGKEIRPLTWSATQGWRWEALPAPRPLYRLAELTARPEARVVIVEGERAADAAAVLFHDVIVTTTPNGAKAARQADLRPLRGREVSIWPDNDEPGLAYAHEIGRLALAAGATRVQILDLASLAGSGA